MKVQILSDLHNEFYRAQRLPLPEIDDAGADVIVLAGDIDVGVEGVHWAAGQAERLHRPIIYIAGNHEFYTWCHEELPTNMKRAAEGSGVHVLENESVVVGDVRFLCATLWSDFRAMGAEWENLSMTRATRELTDYRVIKCHLPDGRHRNLWPADTLSWHARSVTWLTQELNRPSNLKTVVVTHHGASPGCHNRDIWGAPDPISGSFWSDMDSVIASSRARAWVYGHTHSNLRFEIGNVRVVCNQRGYLTDRCVCPGFDPKYTIDLCPGEPLGIPPRNRS